ncbi:MAG: amino acid synthesis family protein [Betaproteobacteria bacterium]|nr:amino acid synthesis family protein [Betaproteobacteria bacterium]
MQIRKTILTRETVHAEAGRSAARPIHRAAALVVIDNPLTGRFVDDLSPLFDVGAELGERLMPDLVKLLGHPVVSYGKAAIVGVSGDLEHSAAILHPKLGKPMRGAIGGGQSLIPSNAKVAAAGAAIDVPLGHKDNPWSFDEIDTWTLAIADAPRPHEIVVIIAISDGGRPNARVDKTRAVT